MLRADDRVHFTYLKKMGESPAHYQAALVEDADTPAMRFGRLLHYLVLGGDFVVWETGDRRGKAWDAFQEEFKDKEIFKRSEVDDAERIAEAVRNDPVVRELELLTGERELLIDWSNQGVPFRSHLDCLGVAKDGPRRGRRHVVDLKSTQCSKPEKFYWEAKRLGYHAQLATYEDAAAYIQQPVDDAFIIAVEKEAPFAVTCFQLTPRLLHEGRILTRSWIERYRICELANTWPAYAQSVVTMDVAEEKHGDVTLVMSDGSEMSL